MIFHLFNASTSHLVPNIAKGIFENARFTNKNGIEHICFLLWVPEKLLFGNKEEELNKYHKLFKSYAFNNYRIIDSNMTLLKAIYSISTKDKLILHSNFSLFGFYPVFLLALAVRGKRFLKRVVHVEWGINPNCKKGRLEWLKHKIATYNYSSYNLVIALTPEDKLLINERYPAANVKHNNYLIPSTIINTAPRDYNGNRKLKLLVSHSGHVHNNHFKSLELLEKFRNENIEILCPLAYGPADYIEKVINYGKSKFGDKFKYFTSLKPLDEYVSLIAGQDIYVTSPEIQTGLYAAFTSLSNGLKVYVGPNLYSFMNQTGYFVFNANEIDRCDFKALSKPLPEIEFHKNQKIYRNHNFNSSLIQFWGKIYND